MKLMVFLALALAACTKPNPAVCCVSEADCGAIGLETVRECGEGLVCVDHDCELPTTCLMDDDCTESTPFCDPGNGCVECLHSDQCPAERPVCDATSHTCAACASDDQCLSNVCDSVTGTCLAESEVLYVSPTGPDAGLCESSAPCSLVNAASISTPSRYTIKLAPGGYTTSVDIIDKTIAIHGIGATVTAASGSPAFHVENEGHLRLEGLTVTSLDSSGAIRCEFPNTGTPTLELVSMTLDTTGAGVVATALNLTIDKSHIRNRSMSGAALLLLNIDATITRTAIEGSITAGGGAVRIINSTLRGNNGTVFDGGIFDVSYSTILDSVVQCGGAGGVQAGSTFNSCIFYDGRPDAPTTTVTGACDIHYSLAFPMEAGLGDTNMTGMDPRFKGVASGDFHLEPGSPAIDRGDPTSTLGVDFDGTARPQGVGRDSGAFEFTP